MKTLYCDGSFDWTHTNKTKEPVVRGKIAVSDGKGFDRVEKVAVGKVEGLRQYINIFELIAIARAIELAKEVSDEDNSLQLFTDSNVAMFWARAGKIRNKVRTLAHDNALEYLKKARLAFGGIVTIDTIPRERNRAGFLLEDELLNGRQPHDL